MRFERHFPFEEMRPEQRQVLDDLDAAWDDKTYFIVDAPTGVGKSGIARAAMLEAGSAYLLTSTKVLQDQYHEEFGGGDLVNLKGQGNYDCNLNRMFRVDHAPCKVMPELLGRCIRRGICAYYSQRDSALRSAGMLTSYAYFLMSSECGPLSETSNPMSPASPRKHRRSLVVCDEAHELEQHLVEFSTAELDPTELAEKYGVAVPTHLTFDDDELVNEGHAGRISGNVAVRLAWFNKKIKEAIEAASEWAGGEPERMSGNAAKQIKVLTASRDHLDRLSKRLSMWMSRSEEEPWIVKPTREGKRLQLTPLRPRRMFVQYMAPLGTKFLLMSASIGDPEMLIDELGLPRDQVHVVQTGTAFDPDRSPIYPLQIARLGFRELDRSIPDVIEGVEAILDGHADQKGIIHAGNYRLTKAILEGLSPRHRKRLIGKAQGSGHPNEYLIERHCKSPEPTVLVSPSMFTGVDLRDDLSRFQIIVKLPWINTQEPRAAAKLLEGDKWYSNQMWQKLIQASGRSTRSEGDHSCTYILDSQFLKSFNKDSQRLPKWFKDRLRWD